MYAILCTRPDIYVVVGLVSRHQSDPGSTHCKEVKRIIRYLKETSGYALCYHANDLHLKGYTDANYGGDLDDRKSTSGCVFLLSTGAVS